MERYNAIKAKCFDALVQAEGMKGVKHTRILNIVMQLRKICNRPCPGPTKRGGAA
jgi:hypothetical protein